MKENTLLEFKWSCDWNITGSSILIKIKQVDKIYNILNDIWSTQWQEDDWENFMWEQTEDIDIIMITHWHLDHIWKLVPTVKSSSVNLKQIVTNLYTWPIIRIQSSDWYKIMEKDFLKKHGMSIPHKSSLRNLNRSHSRWVYDSVLSDYLDDPMKIITDSKWVEFPYTKKDLEDSHRLLRSIKQKEWRKLSDWIEVKSYFSWHALGSSFVYKIKEWNNEKVLCCTWDLWPEYTLVNWEQKTEIPEEYLDCLVVESTYWDKNRESPADSIIELAKQIDFIINKWWNVIIPTFAFHKLPQLIQVIYKLQNKWKISKSAQIYYETSLGSKLMGQYSWVFWPYKDIWRAKKLDYSNREKVLQKWWNIFFITGWMDIERWSWINYLRELEKPNNIWIWTNYIEPTTSLYNILENSPNSIEIWEVKYNVNAEVSRIWGFSGHKDQADLIRYIKQIKFKPWAKIIINHGTINSMKSLADKIKEFDSNIIIEFAESEKDFII